MSVTGPLLSSAALPKTSSPEAVKCHKRYLNSNQLSINALKTAFDIGSVSQIDRLSVFVAACLRQALVLPCRIRAVRLQTTREGVDG